MRRWLGPAEPVLPPRPEIAQKQPGGRGKKKKKDPAGRDYPQVQREEIERLKKNKREKQKSFAF